MPGIKERLTQAVVRVRARSELVDHGFRAAQRYVEAFAGRLAAAVAYYAFFAVFALAVVAYAILGFLVDYFPDLREAVDEFLAESIPMLDAGQITAGRGAAGVFGLIGMVVTGLAWVAALRSSQRLIWELPQEPGKLVLRRLLDLLALAVLGLLVGASLAVVVLLELALAGVPVLRQLGWLLTIGVNLVVAAALLAALPRLRLSPRRLLPPAALVAVGLFLLNTVGRIYFDRVQANPAYAVVASAAGLLVYLYVFHQLVLGAAAWAATSRHGSMADLAGGRADATD